jgi:hypothetical protein
MVGKPGGIVEPGIEYYGDWKNTTNYKKTREAKKKGLVYDIKTKRMRKHKPSTGPVGHVNNPKGGPKIEIKDWTLETKANLKTWMDNTGSTVKDFNKLPDSHQKNIKYGRVTGIRQTPEFAKKLESAVTKQFRNWLSKQDPKTLTADSVDDLIKQSKIKTTSTNQRSGLVNAINRIMEEKEFSKFKNIQLGRVYSQKNINQLSDDLLKAYAEDDIKLVMDTKHKTSISDIRSNKLGALDKAIKNTGLNEETIFNLLDDRDAYVELEKKIATTKGRPRDPDQAKIYRQAENWIVKNSKRYVDPDEFKKAFLRTFDKNSDIVKKLSRADKGVAMHVPFSDWFRTDIMGSSEQAMKGHHKPTYNANQLDTIFKTAIYTNNKNVRNKIIDELTKVIPEKSAKNFPNKRSMDIHRMLNENPLLKKFGLNQKIDGPIARLLVKEIGEDLVKQIGRLRRPWLGTYDLIHYLKDRVNPKYKSMFEEAAQAVRYAQTNQWPEARKSLKLSESIMFDHKVPKALVKLGYADEIEYIKLNPTSAQFNARIKNNQFDKPMIKLVNQWEKATTVDAKSKIVGEMNELKDTFSKKYGNYLDDVKIDIDKTGKPIFSSKGPVVTKKTDLIKSLETSLQHEKFPTMTKTQKNSFLKILENKVSEELGLNKKQTVQLGNRLNSGIPVDDMARMISSDLKIPVKTIGNILGKVLRGFGKAAVVVDPMFAAFDASHAFGKGASGQEAGEYVTKRFGEGILNIPDLAASAVKWGKGKITGEDTPFETGTLYEPFTFAQKGLEEDLADTPENVKLRRIAEIKFDQTMPYMVDVMDMPDSREELEIKKDKFLKEELGENYKITHPKQVEEEKHPTDNLTGVDKYMLSKLDV